jgi:hypothetical protein
MRILQLDPTAHDSDQEISEPDSRISDEHQEENTLRRPSKLRLPKVLRAMEACLRDHISQSKFHGWRMSVLLGCFASSFVLLCNTALIVVGQLHSGYDKDGIATLFRGTEAEVSRWNTIAHIFINMLSTLLFSMSNYTMQVLNSPTRREIDKAHARGKWLDIGVASVHNLKIISRRRAALCVVLSLSSVPLHLL